MALNSFFLQGSQSEQRLIQELINEQLTIYGVEVIYLPRKIVNHDNILNEIERLKKEGIRILNEIPKKGADNKLVCFLHPKDTSGVLIELCQEIK